MRIGFNMFPVVEGKEAKANTIGKAAIIGGCIQCSRRIGKRVRVGIVILALAAVLFTLLLCFLEKVPTLTLLPCCIILVYAVVGYRNYNSVKKA